ncbi:uncharacterized protein CANTADRAFT_52478 [Suhomyces tanzawaensis NRRL Y-17324]|uniref:Uncharacterized protein n=1 Tax=Suhomyces tanzawaensis NRRL Y-17324 TaxID=984487 RepID=A0A1E4SG61_9ASCO|nr:uncharacterized protein CANTADRAFT_52478 [Suhomyces tanzawaensis NRRL Y-17324]ODV78503.1 hypothetical protein CANTADRAFT_52478 [Suhomyces tanzawaensis NRRL Y-17324]
MSGRFQAAAPKAPSTLEKITKSPLFTVGLNTAYFVAGIAFIQSPLMEMLVPQL